MRVDGNEVFVMCSAEIVNVDEFIDATERERAEIKEAA